VVIGGGVVGASCAYELSLRGVQVTLVERGEVGRGCSHGNCGYVCPSHVYPLARPGAIARTLPLMFRRNSPFKVRVRADLALLGWFAAFRAACRDEVVERTMPALNALLWSGKERYEAVMAAEGIDAEYTRDGCIFISRDREHLEHFEGDNRRMMERFGFGARRVDGAELAAMEPTLREGLAGGWLFECDGHVRPDRYMAGLRRALLRRGVQIVEHGEARALVGEGRRAGVLETARGEHRADAFVIAAGAWTPMLHEMMGVRPRIVPGKGYSVTVRGYKAGPRIPMVFEQHRVALTPFEGGLRVGSTMEFAGYDTTIRKERLRLLTDSASLYLKEAIGPTGEGAWFGWRPMSPDGRPYIDWVPRWENVVVAAGHSMIGMSTGPGTGRLVAEMVTGQTPHIDPEPYRLGR
jgi:D-amino-acid dehydrogenase